MKEVMPGDLAIVIKSKRPEEVGRVVKVLNIVSDGEKFFDDNGNLYSYSTKYGYGFLCSGRVRIDEYQPYGVSPFPAHCLMSISGFGEDAQEVS